MLTKTIKWENDCKQILEPMLVKVKIWHAVLVANN